MYYRLTQDLYVENRWYLQTPLAADGTLLDPRIFMRGEFVEVDTPLRLPMRVPGIPLDFTLADFELPIVRRDLGVEIERAAPGVVQRIPVDVGYDAGEYEILNVLKTIDCLDHHRSKITYWTEADRRPDKVGQPRMVIDLIVDPNRITGAAEIFRIAGWQIALIVSSRVATLLSRRSGVQLQPVTAR